MLRSVPPLEPKPPGLALRSLGLVLPGVRKVSGQIKPYTTWWSEQNQTALAAEGPLLTVVGDSTAVGIGATAPDRGYVGRLRDSLTTRDEEPWRVINLAQSGARVADALERQLPILAQLPTADFMVCCIGTNDVVWGTDTTGLRDRLRQLVELVPEQALVAVVAGGSARARLANRALKGAANERGLTIVNPWGEPGPGASERLAADRFHPNDLGYALMARPFARTMNTPEPPTS